MMTEAPAPLEPACAGHPQLHGVTEGVYLVQRKPDVLEQPVMEGSSEVDGMGVSIYGSVIKDGGLFRMWYQAWPKQPLKDGDSALVACAESDDGLSWRKPSHRVMEWGGSRDNHLTNLPFHSPSVMIDPTAPPEARYRAFGCTGRRKQKDLPQGFDLPVSANYAYYSARSADGLHWTVDGPAPAWTGEDVITAAWDPWAAQAIAAFKRGGQSAGMYRRRFFTATWAGGRCSEPVSALVPDEYDDQLARARGFESADYYGLGLYPGPTVTIGFLWNFLHQPPLGSADIGRYGSIGCVSVSLIYQLERGGRWHHLSGRPDWMSPLEMPDWASGAIYTAASPIEVGDETWLYFTGTRDRHGWAGDQVKVTDLVGDLGRMRIGLARWPRGRLIGYESRLRGIVTLKPLARPGVSVVRLKLNVEARPGGRVRAQWLDDKKQPIPGYTFDDCLPLTGSHLAAEIAWRDTPGGAQPHPGSAQIELDGATLYGFQFVTPGEVG